MTSFPALSRSVLAGLALFCFSATLLTAQADAPPAPAQDATPAPTPDAAPAKLAGQPAPPLPQEPEPSVTIRQTVQRVILDVMVRDADGKPVHGLKADDFSITEDKQPQRVLSFDVYDFDKASISRAPNAPPLPPHVFDLAKFEVEQRVPFNPKLLVENDFRAALLQRGVRLLRLPRFKN